VSVFQNILHFNLHFCAFLQSLVHSVQAPEYCESIHIYVVVVLMLLQGCLCNVHVLLWFGNFIHRYTLKPGYIKSNISENTTNNKLYQIASIDASFIFTSSALAGLIRAPVSETFFLELHDIYLFYTRSVLDY
jgi:hypothetical protein